MINCEMTREADLLVIRVNVDEATMSNANLSASGKSRIIASTQGNVDVDGLPGAKIGLNIYVKA